MLALIARNMRHQRRIGPEAMHDPSLRLRATDIICPSLVVRGTADGVIPPSYAEDWIAALPDSRQVRVQGAGHLPHVEDPDGFRAAVGWSAAGEPLWS